MPLNSGLELKFNKQEKIGVGNKASFVEGDLLNKNKNHYPETSHRKGLILFQFLYEVTQERVNIVQFLYEVMVSTFPNWNLKLMLFET